MSSANAFRNLKAHNYTGTAGTHVAIQPKTHLGVGSSKGVAYLQFHNKGTGDVYLKSNNSDTIGWRIPAGKMERLDYMYPDDSTFYIYSAAAIDVDVAALSF